MVGIVIVSHSAKLATGVWELAEQMVQGKVPLIATGGIDDPENPIGTDPMKVYEAIETVYGDDGVVVLMDLGSALLSAEMALEFLTPEQQQNVSLSDAPLVEGTMAAAIQASVGGTREQVLAEAKGALAVKVAQLAIEEIETGEDTTVSPTPNNTQTNQIFFTVKNRQGLHARPAAKLVSTANRFAADLQLSKDDKSANAKSINQVATLGVRQGDTVLLVATGADGEEALAAVAALADDNFGENEDEILPAATAVPQPQLAMADGIIMGIPASPGIAIGPVFLYQPRIPEIEKVAVNDAAAEWQRVQTAVATALQELTSVQAQITKQASAAEAAIFEAHALILQDPDLRQTIQARIKTESFNAESIWQEEIASLANTYRALDDPYMQARATDVEDVGQRVLRLLTGLEAPALDFSTPAILIAADLTPSDTARLDPQRVVGICTEMGGATSHSAILSRNLGIPAIVGLGKAVWKLTDEQVIAFNGRTGQLWSEPDEAQLNELTQQREAWLAEEEKAKAASQATAVTSDGHTIEIAANIGGPKDVATALSYGAEGVGLFRTEFLFLDRQTAPSEEEQFFAYRQAADALGERPLIIRTLDVGGDKPLPYLDLGQEDNPFLGWRGIRFCLDKPEIFKPQLRAILRAGVGRQIKIMFPMIGSMDELRRSKTLLDEAQAELRSTQTPFDEQIEIGVMIEVPAAVAIADQIAAEVDFFSIGTNDLTQYTMAADRGNTRVADLAQALQPAVLRLVQQTVTAGHEAGIWVGMCGELAGNPLATPVLIGLGLDELSMSAPAIPGVKNAIRKLNCAQAKEVTEVVLGLDSATAVNKYLEQLNTERGMEN